LLAKEVIANDTTAAAVRALNPTQFSADNQVPLFLYKGLSTIMFAGDNSLLNISVSSQGGQDDTNVDASINIYSITGNPFDSIDTLRKPDSPTAESCLVKILVRLHPSVSDAKFDVLKQADLRIRYQLDSLVSAACRKKNGELSGRYAAIAAACTDKTIDFKKPFVLRYLRDLKTANAQQRASLYCVDLHRIFVKNGKE
jgi:hypothetical protein